MNGQPHVDYKRLEAFKPTIMQIQELATKHGIHDIFQDNGGKLLELLLLTGLTGKPGREGNDATDNTGQEYELKTMNAALVSSFSTHHHMNLEIIKKYRLVKWLFGIYRNIELVSVYLVPVNGLDEKFTKWEQRIIGKTTELGAHGRPVDMNAISINNPKINASTIEKVGELIYGITYSELRRTLKTKKKYSRKAKAKDEQIELDI